MPSAAVTSTVSVLLPDLRLVRPVMATVAAWSTGLATTATWVTPVATVIVLPLVAV